MIKLSRQFVILGVLLMQSLLLSRAVEAQQWATVSGKFVIDKEMIEPPVPGPNNCAVGAAAVMAPTVVVNKNKELAEVFVYVRSEIKQIHPEVEKAALATPVILNNKNCVFEPRVQFAWTKQTLELKNSDGVGHNMNYSSINHGFNKIVPPMATEKHEFDPKKIDKSDSIPGEVACNVHPWMKGRLLVRSNPYGTVSAADGSFKIEKIPAGNHEFVIWHEESGYVAAVPFKGGTTDNKGRFTLNLNADTDLGTITIPAAKLKIPANKLK
jgi:hypothetical protein